MADQNAMTMMFYARLQNDVSKVLTQIETDAKKAFEGATGAGNKFGDSTQNLTKWIKEQRTEQRQHNFLFQQTREVVAAASTGLALFGNTIGQSNEQMKKVTDSLNAGFVAFQGLNNILGFIPGPWGIVISLAAGAAVAIQQMTGETSKAQAEMFKLEGKLIDLQLKLGEIAPAMKRAFLEADVVRAENDLKRLNDATIDYIATATNFQNGVFQGVIYKGVGSPKDVENAKIALAEAKVALKDFNNSVEGFQPIQIMPDLSMQQQWIQQASTVTGIIEKNTVNSNKKVSSINAQTAKDYLAQWDAAEKLKLQLREESFAREQELLQNYQQTSMVVFQTVGSLFGNMLTGQDANARNILRNIANSFITMAESALFAATAMANAKSIMTFWTSMIADAPLLLAGFTALESARAIVNSFHQGGSMFVNAPASQDVPVAFMARGQEKIIVQTESQQQSGGGGNTFIFNNYSPVTAEEFVIGSLTKLVRKTGMTIDKLTVNNSKGLSLNYM